VAELDLARLPSQTLSGTSERFGAHAWTVGNAANADTFDLLQGTGLRIAPKTGTAYVSEPTAPFVELALAELVPDYQAGDRLLVQAWVDAAGLDAGTNLDGRAYGLQVGSGTSWSDTYVGLYPRVPDPWRHHADAVVAASVAHTSARPSWLLALHAMSLMAPPVGASSPGRHGKDERSYALPVPVASTPCATKPGCSIASRGSSSPPTRAPT